MSQRERKIFQERDKMVAPTMFLWGEKDQHSREKRTKLPLGITSTMEKGTKLPRRATSPKEQVPECLTRNKKVNFVQIKMLEI
jgi:hypothetical protein